MTKRTKSNGTLGRRDVLRAAVGGALASQISKCSEDEDEDEDEESAEAPQAEAP